MSEFRMPSLGADMEAGTLVEWLVKPGDQVVRGDIVAVVETQKGAIEIEIFVPGTVEKLLVGLHTKVPVGTVLARIRSPDGAKPETALAPPAAPAAQKPQVMPAAHPTAPPSASPPAAAPPAPSRARSSGRVRASPAARKLAQHLDIDLGSLSGSGAGGAILRADVERKRATPTVEPKRAAGLDLDAMRTAIATAMARSKREIPHYYLSQQVDVTPCEQWLARTNSVRSPADRLLLGLLAVRSVALAVGGFPAFNGFYRDGHFEPASAVHAGVAISIRGGGLAAPALHDADRTPIDELMARLRDLVQRTRAGRLRSSELSEATITVSSLGERGVESLFGVIYPPQVAIVGFGKVVARPWVVDGAIGPRSVVTITLAADHRVSDGHAGALFLARIGELLQEPDKL
ncbi:MAG: 2-oxo acid dehydrogenase subunit E2 [Hyphomicrobiales bacterium]|nr:2-oxo acid dehydrogenase subunit E2 [Hyphomicrobiales bacterium]